MIRIPGDRDDGAQELYVGTIYKANSLQWCNVPWRSCLFVLNSPLHPQVDSPGLCNARRRVGWVFGLEQSSDVYHLFLTICVGDWGGINIFDVKL
jgi:hypothetical protein